VNSSTEPTTSLKTGQRFWPWRSRGLAQYTSSPFLLFCTDFPPLCMRSLFYLDRVGFLCATPAGLRFLLCSTGGLLITVPFSKTTPSLFHLLFPPRYHRGSFCRFWNASLCLLRASGRLLSFTDSFFPSLNFSCLLPKCAFLFLLRSSPERFSLSPPFLAPDAFVFGSARPAHAYCSLSV